MNELCLFAGAGGGLLGTKHLLGFNTVCYVENADYCIQVLKARIADGLLDDAPVWDDIKTFNGKPWAGCVDIITAGFPCQPFSVAGKRRANKDERNLWPETIRVIREVRPRYAFCENVPGLIGGHHGYFGRILDDLSQSGYDARWCIVSAADVGAPHLRKRLWILAYTKQFGWGRRHHGDAGRCERSLQATRPSAGDKQGALAYSQSARENATQQPRQRNGSIKEGQDVARTESTGLGWEYERGFQPQAQRSCESLGNTNGERIQGCGGGSSYREGQRKQPSCQAGATNELGWWESDPAEGSAQSRVGRLANGIPDRVERQRAIGNAQVPRVVAVAWKLLMG